MTEPRQIAWPAYLVAIGMIVIPLSDVFTSLYPWRFFEARWRFGAVGLVSSSLLIPLAGLLIAYVTTLILDHRRTRRVIGGLSFAAAALCLLGLVLFALDAVQTRASMPPAMRLSFNVASTAAALKTLFATAIFVAVGISASRGPKARSTEAKSRGIPLFKVEPAPVESLKPGGPTTG